MKDPDKGADKEEQVSVSGNVMLPGLSINSMDGPKDPEFTMATPMIRRARMYERAMRTLIADQPDNSIPIAHLAAHALEVGFKAFLFRTGQHKEADVRRQPYVGHDLERAWSKSYSSGLSLDPTPPAWLVRLNSLHNSPFLLRYAHKSVNVLVLPSQTDLEQGVADVLAAVESATGP